MSLACGPIRSSVFTGIHTPPLRGRVQRTWPTAHLLGIYRHPHHTRGGAIGLRPIIFGLYRHPVHIHTRAPSKGGGGNYTVSLLLHLPPSFSDGRFRSLHSEGVNVHQWEGVFCMKRKKQHKTKQMFAPKIQMIPLYNTHRGAPRPQSCSHHTGSTPLSRPTVET